MDRSWIYVLNSDVYDSYHLKFLILSHCSLCIKSTSTNTFYVCKMKILFTHGVVRINEAMDVRTPEQCLRVLNHLSPFVVVVFFYKAKLGFIK